MDKEFDFPVAFHFKVVIGNSNGSETSFQEVSGLSLEMETETVREGGENSFTWELPKGVKHNNLELKRGLVSSKSLLYTWCMDCLEGSFAKPITTKNIKVMLLDKSGHSLSAWTFSNAYPVKWAISDLNSTKNDIVVESISLKYSNMKRV